MQSVMNHSFAQVPSANVGRSQFDLSHGHKTTIDADYIYPITWMEVLPGDTFTVNGQFFARMTTPIHPLMDNLHMDTFYFYVPYRILWTNWEKFLGAQDDPGDSIDFTIPRVGVPGGGAGYVEDTIYDYMGLPPGVDIDPLLVRLSALPFRAYNLIWNDWFRDENLQDSVTESYDDGADASGDYALLKRGKRHDYFTSCLPWPQKGDTAVSLPLGTSAPVDSTGVAFNWTDGSTTNNLYAPDGADVQRSAGSAWSTANLQWGAITGLQADLSSATAATINALRLAVTTQQFLERDARGGTRINEIILSHFGVTVPDYRVQRPEYLGGSTTLIDVNTVAQTSQTATTPQGTLAAFVTGSERNSGFHKSFTEHGLIMCLVNVRADLTYQQGVNKSFLRQTRYDLFWPEFQNIGEQVVQQVELEATGTATDDDVFGYQERYAEYRFQPSRISSAFRSGHSSTLHAWHLSENLSAPALDSTFIPSNTPMDRVLAIASQPDFILDTYFNVRAVRPMSMYGVPGLARF